MKSEKRCLTMRNNTTENPEPIRIQRKRTKGWRMPLNTVYVGRGSRLGNPFRVVKLPDGKWSVKTDGNDKCTEILVKHCKVIYQTKKEAAIDAIKCYDFWLLPYTHEGGTMAEYYQAAEQIEAAIATLSGKNVACWCRLDEPCHADLLLKIANPHLPSS